MFVESNTQLSSIFKKIILYEEFIVTTKAEYVKSGLLVMLNYINKYNIEFERIYDENNAFVGYGFTSSFNVNECFADIKDTYRHEFSNQENFSNIIHDDKFNNYLKKRVNRFVTSILDYAFLSLVYAFEKNSLETQPRIAFDYVSSLENIIKNQGHPFFLELYKSKGLIDQVYYRRSPRNIKCISHQFIMKQPIVLSITSRLMISENTTTSTSIVSIPVVSESIASIPIVSENTTTSTSIASIPIVSENTTTSTSIASIPIVSENTTTSTSIASIPIVSENTTTSTSIASIPIVSENTTTSTSIASIPIVSENTTTSTSIASIPIIVSENTTTSTSIASIPIVSENTTTSTSIASIPIVSENTTTSTSTSIASTSNEKKSRKSTNKTTTKNSVVKKSSRSISTASNMLSQAILSSFEILKSSRTKKSPQSLMLQFILDSDVFKRSLMRLKNMVTKKLSIDKDVNSISSIEKPFPLKKCKTASINRTVCCNESNQTTNSDDFLCSRDKIAECSYFAAKKVFDTTNETVIKKRVRNLKPHIDENPSRRKSFRLEILQVCLETNCIPVSIPIDCLVKSEPTIQSTVAEASCTFLNLSVANIPAASKAQLPASTVSSSHSTVAETQVAVLSLAEAIKQSKSMLHPNIDPVELGPSRREEFNEMVADVQFAIDNKQGVTIYACGLPGTGKTMVINKAVNHIEKMNPPETLKFRKVFIQGTAVDTHILYQSIGAQLDIIADNSCTSSSSAFANIKEKVLTLFYPNKSRSKKVVPMTLLFIDETDQAPTDDVRRLINISNMADSRLILMGSGNNVSLTFELNLLMEPNLVIFKEFVNSDLVNILQNRIVGGIVSQQGLKLIAMKLLGRSSGDARQAIQILCQCLEYCIKKGVSRNLDFWKDASEKHSSEFVQLADVISTLNEIGVGANREPDQVGNLSMYSRIFITAMILSDVGVTSSASRNSLMICYINFLMEIRMDGEAESITQNKADIILDELYSGGIVIGGHSTFGRHRCFNRDASPHKPELKLMISPINVARCKTIESVLKRKLDQHFKAKASANNSLLLLDI